MASNVLRAVAKRQKALAAFTKAQNDLVKAEALISSEIEALKDRIQNLEIAANEANRELAQTVRVRTKLDEFLS